MKIEVWNGHEIRFVEKDGEWWAVAKDVAAALGYQLPTNMTRLLDKKDKGMHKVNTTSDKDKCPKTQTMLIISEFGIYDAVFNSHKPEAKDFKRWVYGVLKTLRQASGLEAYQSFRLLDKQVQKTAMAALHDGNPEADQKYYIKANTLANKAVAIQYGLPKAIKKEAMTPEMLEDRQKWLQAAVELMTMREKYNLAFSVSDRLYELAQGERGTA